MKICENCGREYGDANPFCPFCDERYGVIIPENDVISAEGLPPYKEEFHAIGETSVKYENFAANRDEIYKRNVRLAARENFLQKKETKVIYEPVMPLAEIGRDGAIAPYKPPNPVVKKLFHRRKKQKTVKVSRFRKFLCISASVYFAFLVIAFISWFRTTDTYYKYEEIEEYKKYIEVTPLPEEITITNESGIEFKLEYECDVDSNFYMYTFKFTNTTDDVVDNIYKEFEALEFSDKFFFLSAVNSDGLCEDVSWDNGIANVRKTSEIKPGETVTGVIRLDFSGD